jgi:hypothetical protein
MAYVVYGYWWPKLHRHQYVNRWQYHNKQRLFLQEVPRASNIEVGISALATEGMDVNPEVTCDHCLTSCRATALKALPSLRRNVFDIVKNGTIPSNHKPSVHSFFGFLRETAAWIISLACFSRKCDGCEIWSYSYDSGAAQDPSSDSVAAQDPSLLPCDAVSWGKWFPTFRSIVGAFIFRFKQSNLEPEYEDTTVLSLIVLVSYTLTLLLYEFHFKF